MAVRLVLFVAGGTPRSRSARATLVRPEAEAREPTASGAGDVREEPGRAKAERILLTLTLVREEPSPPRRAVGDLGDGDCVGQVDGAHTREQGARGWGSPSAASGILYRLLAGGGAVRPAGVRRNQ